METKGVAVGVSELGAGTVADMCRLMSRYFDNVDHLAFEHDLAEKDIVALIRAGEELVGFSTVQLRVEELDRRKIRILFSGDTIVDPAYWGSRELQRCVVRLMLRAMQEDGPPLYWLLICSGYRTYRYLPMYFHEFWPRHDRPTPANTQALMDALAGRRFGTGYRNGVVIQANGQLRPHVSPIGARQRRNPHVAFFEAANPGHDRGHELVCLARIAPDNWRRPAHRITRGNRA